VQRRKEKTMNRQSHLISLLVIAVVALVLAGPTTAGELVPFQGGGSGVLYADFTISGVGQLTHMGRMTFASNMVGGVTFTAANGDMLFVFGLGSEVIDSTHILNDHVISGGTGRFQDATGSFTTLLEFASPLFTTPPPTSSAFPIPFTWVLEGVISPPGAN
jgi:hypothetical protein